MSSEGGVCLNSALCAIPGALCVPGIPIQYMQCFWCLHAVSAMNVCDPAGVHVHVPGILIGPDT